VKAEMDHYKTWLVTSIGIGVTGLVGFFALKNIALLLFTAGCIIIGLYCNRQYEQKYREYKDVLRREQQDKWD